MRRFFIFQGLQAGKIYEKGSAPIYMSAFTILLPLKIIYFLKICC